MAEYTSVVVWSRDGAAFTDNRYSRGHRWLFDGGVEVPASSSPHVVPLPLSVAAAVDPEEAFVASNSPVATCFGSCPSRPNAGSSSARRALEAAGIRVLAEREGNVQIDGQEPPGLRQ